MDFKKITFSGFVKYGYDGNFPTIKLIDNETNIDLVKKFKAIFDLFESEVSVDYFISDVKKTDDEIKESYLMNIWGAISADYTEDSYRYSSLTFGTDYNSYLKIGGHDLFEEMKDFEGKWCVLTIIIK